MCDTLVALPAVTRDGAMLFAKNSDRHPNEAHELVLVPRAHHAVGSHVRCTYRSIEQAPETHRVVLAKPWWIWGAEMGVNEHGVVIGNEALFTREPLETTPALTGMDLLRVGLERGATAREALEVITALLARWGQGGNCAFDGILTYSNAFLIADASEAWVLETAGRHWAAKRVADVYAISNCLSIGADFDLASDGLVEHAVRRGYCRRARDFHFARAFSDTLYTFFAAGRPRRRRTAAALESLRGRIDLASMMQLLRDHRRSPFRPGADLSGADVCMHASAGPVRISQSTGAMVSRVRADEPPLCFVTGTSATCTGTFKPLWVDAGVPDDGPRPGKRYDAAALFWRHERLHRAVIADYAPRMERVRAERDLLEQRFLERALEGASREIDERRTLSQACFDEASEALERAIARVEALGPPRAPVRDALHAHAWRAWSEDAAMPHARSDAP